MARRQSALALIKIRSSAAASDRPSLESWQTFGVLDIERSQHIQIAIDEMSLTMIGFNWWARLKVCQIIQRASRPAGIETLWGSGQKPQKICFREAVQIDDEIKLLRPDFLDEFENAKDGHRLEAVAQRDAIHDQRLIRKTG